MVNRRILTAGIGLPVLLCGLACSRNEPTAPASAPAVPPAAAPLDPDARVSDSAIRFLEDKAKADPDDFIARNKLVGYYLQRMRETGSLTYLELATRAAHESLASSPAMRNVGGLAGLAQVELASHDFASARDHSLELRKADPDKLYPFLTLGDAQLELGDYAEAAATYHELERRAGDGDSGVLNAATRLARLALLNGQPDVATANFSKALDAALRLDPKPRETVAWCYWQLGETAFSIGDYATAEQRYDDALTTFPDYYRALGSLARTRAARGDSAKAIELYERATHIVPDPLFVAALGDLYKLAGREKEAAAEYDLVEQIGRLSQLNGVVYNRQLAMFWADHGLNADAAYEHASKEYETRRDVFGADAVAWTALKAGKLVEAATASKEALRLGTKDARLLYHAGMIAKANGDTAAARSYLEQALKLSPRFDPMQAPIAASTLAGV